MRVEQCAVACAFDHDHRSLKKSCGGILIERMERSRERVSFPAITDADDGANHVPKPDRETWSRMELLENRLNYQEKTTRGLVDRALKVKEDIIESLSITQMSWQGERKARDLLQEHIKTITSVVKRLSREIEVLDEELRSRYSQVDGQNAAVKNLELHHVAGVTDLRGRVSRCDAAIQRLVMDTRNCNESIHELKQKQQISAKEINDKLQSMEASINNIGLKFERYMMEQDSTVQKLKGSASEQVVRLDSKTKAVVEGIQGSISSNRLWAESEYFKLSQDFQTRLERFEGLMVERQDKLERRVDHYLSKVEKMLEEEKGKYYSIWEVRLKEVMSTHEKALNESSNSMRREYKLGFSNVHESVSSLQKVFTAKLKLVEDDLRKSINSILRMVVLV